MENEKTEFVFFSKWDNCIEKIDESLQNEKSPASV